MEEYRKFEPFFGSWTIVKKIGEGAFGKVFEVERTDFGKNFRSALKIVSIPQNASEVESISSEGLNAVNVQKYYDSMAMDLVNEFELLAKLQGNSYIVSYDDHMVKKRPNGIGYDIFIRMELLTPISRKLKNGEMPQKETLQMGIDICKALEVCEKYHIIHRDIKPENIFLSEIGNYKLGDFGVARTMESGTHVLSKKGTQSYMAPELYKEEATNGTVDIYSLGIVLYRLCNKNRLPFMPPYPQEVSFVDRENALKKRIMGEKMPAPCNAHPEFARIILKACEYDVRKRYQNATQMRKDLEELQRRLLLEKRQDSMKEAVSQTYMSSAASMADSLSMNLSASMSRSRSAHSDVTMDNQRKIQQLAGMTAMQNMSASTQTGRNLERAQAKADGYRAQGQTVSQQQGNFNAQAKVVGRNNNGNEQIQNQNGVQTTAYINRGEISQMDAVQKASGLEQIPLAGAIMSERAENGNSVAAGLNAAIQAVQSEGASFQDTYYTMNGKEERSISAQNQEKKEKGRLIWILGVLIFIAILLFVAFVLA